ncbi:hypothetical protein KI387_022709, partial [Taxus chinensis]
FLMARQNIAEVRTIVLHFIKLMHRVNLVEALDEFGQTQALLASIHEGHTLEEVRQVIMELLAHNLVLMRFAEGVHVTCEDGNAEGKRLEKLDLLGLLALVFTEFVGIVGLYSKLDFTYNFLLCTSREGAKSGDKGFCGVIHVLTYLGLSFLSLWFLFVFGSFVPCMLACDFFLVYGLYGFMSDQFKIGWDPSNP